MNSPQQNALAEANSYNISSLDLLKKRLSELSSEIEILRAKSWDLAAKQKLSEWQKKEDDLDYLLDYYEVLFYRLEHLLNQP